MSEEKCCRGPTPGRTTCDKSRCTCSKSDARADSPPGALGCSGGQCDKLPGCDKPFHLKPFDPFRGLKPVNEATCEQEEAVKTAQKKVMKRK